MMTIIDFGYQYHSQIEIAVAVGGIAIIATAVWTTIKNI